VFQIRIVHPRSCPDWSRSAKSSSASRLRRTTSGQRSLSGIVADKKHSSRALRESLVPTVVADADKVVAGSDFRIIPATYDSRYADMMAAAALDELWRERGASSGVGRWNENLDGGLDRLTKDLAVAKCTDWLTKHQQHHHQPAQRKRFPVFE